MGGDSSGVLSGAASGASAGSSFGPYGAIIGAVLGAAGSYLGGKSSAGAAERSYKHRYQWQVKDLQKAGLNPMLAVSQGAPVPAQPHFPNIGEGAVEGASRGASAVAAASLLRSQLDMNAASAEKSRAEAAQAGSAAEVNRAMVPEIAARTELHGATARELASRIQYQQALLPEITARIEGIHSNIAKNSAEIAKYKAELRLIASQIGKNESEIRWNDLNFHQKQRLFPLVSSLLQSEAWTKYYGITEAEYRHKFWKDEKEGEDIGDYRWWKSMGTQMGPFSSAAGIAGLLR